MLRNMDLLRIDYHDLNTPDPRGVRLLFVTAAADGAWQYVPLSNCPRLVIGRDPQQCNIVQSLPYISGRHAEIVFRNGFFYLSDCGSRAGTWLNGARTGSSPMPLKENDYISICGRHFIFLGNGLFYMEDWEKPTQRSRQGPRADGGAVLLSAEIQSKKVPDQSGHGQKELIRGIRVKLCTGQLTALLGGSGAGKSTLMNCLNGMDQTGLTGRILFRGEDLYRNFDRLKCFVGSVPQDNVLHQMLPVEEELQIAARLYLPRDTQKEEINRRVDRALTALNLQQKRRDQIQKLSGGERKRVNIGVELVADRVLLCLDEPDAGLDPSSKSELFQMLRKLARSEDKCILVIIHDISRIDLFDQVIMMAKAGGVGRLAFAGTPEMARRHFQVDELSAAYSLLERSPEKYVMEF